MVDTQAALYTAHERTLTTLYADVGNFARHRGAVAPGTTGSVIERSNAAGFRFYAHQFYDANGKRVEKYIAGPVGNPDAEAKALELRDGIEAAGTALKNVRLLIREGFKYVDSKAYATLAALHNHGLFEAGALLVGSHAYGVLLNELGARAAQYATLDVDIARPAKFAFPARPEIGFLDMLRSSGIRFAEVAALNPKKPAASFKEAGKSLFQVDLLAPAADETVGLVPVPELKAHATSLPYLRYLLGDSQPASVLAREGCFAVRVPTPERFALHKLIVSQLRRRSEKAVRDAEQAAVLLAVLSERHPGALEEAAVSLPRSAKKHALKASASARSLLKAHPAASRALESLF
jgi:hypothetical protein